MAASYNYGGQIIFDQSIDFRNKAPLDIRVSVPSLSDLDKIENPYIGLVTYVSESEQIYVCKGFNAQKKAIWSSPAAGIPVYDQEIIDEISKNNNGIVPNDKYISVMNKETDLLGYSAGTSYKLSGEGNYADILFKAVRELQNEVTRLRNSFKYGITSYQGTATAMSEALTDDITSEEQAEFDEPIWAIDENNLSSVYTANIGKNWHDSFDVIGQGGVDATKDGVLKIEGDLKWSDQKIDNVVSEVTDNKLFLYMRAASLNENITLYGLDNSALTRQFNLNIFKNGVDSQIYNIMLCISRKQVSDESDVLINGEVPETEEYGENSVFLSISDSGNNTITEGFLNSNFDKVSDETVKLEDRFYLSAVDIMNTDLYKLAIYSRYQDFSHQIIPEKPSDDTYRYKASHIVIRAVETIDELNAVTSQLPDNELVWQTDAQSLWIKSKGKMIPIGSAASNKPSTGDNDIMTDTEILEILAKKGIIYKDNQGLQLSDVSGITFINNNTNKRFEYTPNEAGVLVGREQPGRTFNQLLADVVQNWPAVSADSLDDAAYSVRGFFGTYNGAKTGKLSTDKITQDYGLGADRVRISAVYSPYKSQAKDGVYGCSHGYIELENTSDQDYPLDGFYLHYTYPSANGRQIVHLPLKGVIKAGSTFLIRCKQYADFNDKSCFIKVDTYDMEWYLNGELLDISTDEAQPTNKPDGAYALAMTYGLANMGSNTMLLKATTSSLLSALGLDKKVSDKKAANLYSIWYVDSINWHSNWCTEGSVQLWAAGWIASRKNAIIKNNFALDPAKQAFNGTSQYDSSRARMASTGWGSAACDIQMLDLSKETVSFEKSDEEYPVANWTPKASYCNKNVSTDKTKLDTEKPNMLTCSFGADATTTRCFNWISCGAFDEYIFIKEAGQPDSKYKRFESYKTTAEMPEVSGKYDKDSSTFPKRKRFPQHVKNGYYVSKPESGSDTIENIVYARIHSRFPGDGTFYTAHKLILDIVGSALTSGTKQYTYIAGRSKKDGTPDYDHCTEEYTFTLYSKNVAPKIYHISDQQGFQWIEYQAWAAAAKVIDDKIKADFSGSSNSSYAPVLINTGDMTQNGTRVNEWLDYYNAGKCLFKHFEQCNVVGNNDLCGTDPLILGTGDDIGKSNSFYFHVFYCQEVATDTQSGCNTVDKGIVPVCNGKYIPSLYGVTYNNYYLLFVNSEITEINSRDWYNLRVTPDVAINIYTGWSIEGETSSTYKAAADVDKDGNQSGGFTTIYTMLFNMIKKASGKRVVAVCHEMPFTVITNESLKAEEAILANSRSFGGSNATALIGSHLNQLSSKEKCIYWFSRLLEHYRIKLCIGGHKHTYALTYPVRERYMYKSGDTYKDSAAGPMVMTATLENDDCQWYATGTDSAPFGDQALKASKIHLSKFPYVKRKKIENESGAAQGKYYPYTPKEDLTDGVVYFMMQATGFKLKSNKELPSAQQAFSEIIPETTIKKDGSDKPSGEQQYPMFGIIDLGDNTQIYLARIHGVLNDDAHSLSQEVIPNPGAPTVHYLNPDPSKEVNGFKMFDETADNAHVMTTVKFN